MKKEIFLLIGCFSISLWAGAQSADRSLVSIAGEQSQGETMTLQWTVGDIMVESHATDNGMLTEGFIQPNLEIIELREEYSTAKVDTKIKIWPMPVSDFLNIQIQGESEDDISLTLYDLNGKRMLTKSLDMSLAINELNLESITAGSYILQINNSDDRHIQSFMIIKPKL